MDQAQLNEKKIPVNGIEINYQTMGNPNNPSILLINGLGTQMIEWRQEFCQLLVKNDLFVIRFDNRDVGLSSKLIDAPTPSSTDLVLAYQRKKRLEIPYTLLDMAKDAVGLLDALHIKTTHILGVSMGGMIAQTVAIHYPDRVKTLISIMSSTGNPQLPQGKPEAMALLVSRPPSDRNEYIENSLKTFRILNGPVYPVDEEYVRLTAGKAYDRNYHPAGIGRQLVAILGSGSRNDALKKLKIPTLVIHGDSDPLIPLEAGKDTAKSIPNAKLKIINGMGHTLPVAVINDVINEIGNHINNN